jgi:hypothetical protein
MRHPQALYSPSPLRFFNYLKIRTLQRELTTCLGDGCGHTSWPRRVDWRPLGGA